MWPGLYSKRLFINYGEGGLQNGKIRGPKLFAASPQDRLKLVWGLFGKTEIALSFFMGFWRAICQMKVFFPSNVQC